MIKCADLRHQKLKHKKTSTPLMMWSRLPDYFKYGIRKNRGEQLNVVSPKSGIMKLYFLILIRCQRLPNEPPTNRNYTA